MKSKGGANKTKLEDSNNWPAFEKVIDGDNFDYNLKLLLDEQYITPQMADEARQLLKKSKQPVSPAEAKKFEAARKQYEARRAAWDKDYADWREANGIKAELRGMDSEHGHVSTRWADDNLPTATGAAQTELRDYTGQTYRDWNRALRDMGGQVDSDGNLIFPSGRFGKKTRTADKGFTESPESFTTRRGTGWAEFADEFGNRLPGQPKDPRDLVGKTFEWQNYVSNSVTERSAFGGDVQLVTHVPKGAKINWARPYSKHPGENEVVFMRGQHFFVHDVYHSGTDNTWVVEIEILVDDVAASAYKGLTPKPSSKPFGYSGYR